MLANEPQTFCPTCHRPTLAGSDECDTCETPTPPTGWPADPWIGRAIAGRYHLRRRMAAGSFGVIFEGVQMDQDIELGPVAVKILRPDRADKDDSKRRFLDEARSARALQTPHTIKVFDAGIDERTNTPYTVMELLDLPSLADLIAEEGTLRVDRALRITEQIASAMEESHRMEIIHRDIKPSNVLIGPSDFVKILDFGIARRTAERGKEHHTKIGTPIYAAPEQAAGAPIDGRADIYSLGIVLSEMLTGHRGTVGDTPSLVPANVLALAKRMTVRSPEGRIPSMTDVRREIAKLQGWEPPAPSVRPKRPSLPPVDRSEEATGRTAVTVAERAEAQAVAATNRAAIEAENEAKARASSSPPPAAALPLKSDVTFERGDDGGTFPTHPFLKRIGGESTPIPQVHDSNRPESKKSLTPKPTAVKDSGKTPAKGTGRSKPDEHRNIVWVVALLAITFLVLAALVASRWLGR